MINKIIFRKSCRLWDNLQKSCTAVQATTDTHSEYGIIIVFFPLQQRLRERAPVLRYTYIACLAYNYAIYLTTLPINHAMSHRLLRNTEPRVESSCLVIYQNLFEGTEEKSTKPHLGLTAPPAVYEPGAFCIHFRALTALFTLFGVTLPDKTCITIQYLPWPTLK
jgi:hypothetical protein